MQRWCGSCLGARKQRGWQGSLPFPLLQSVPAERPCRGGLGRAQGLAAQEGLQSVPVADDLDVLKGLLHTLNLTDLIAQHLYGLVQQRLETGQEMTTDTVRRHMCRENITTVLKVCLCAFVRVYVVGFLSIFQTLIFETRSNDFFSPPPLSLSCYLGCAFYQKGELAVPSKNFLGSNWTCSNKTKTLR